MSLTVRLYSDVDTPDGTPVLVGVGTIPPARAFPTYVRVSMSYGPDRLFIRRGESTGDGVFDEVIPVDATVIEE